jgi:peptidoglycan/LPS O-acetylase OafA/YrhL
MVHPGVIPLLATSICMGFFLGVGWLFAHRVGFFRDQTSLQAGGRHEALDGLRGFLALGVFFCHSASKYSELTTGERLEGLSTPYRLMGEGAVVFFFMITGFLFWAKALKMGGRIDFVGLIRGRILRIGPMYLLTVGLMVAIVLAGSGYRLLDPPSRVALFCGKVLGLGAFHLGSFNGVLLEKINGVLWTLTYEWPFYAALPALGFVFARRRRRRRMIALVAVATIVRACRGPNRDLDLSAIFLCGMVTAESLASFGPLRPVAGRVASAVCLAILASLPVFFATGYAPGAYLSTAFVFFCIANGNTIYGLLTTPAARFLGTISYSIYLTHNLALYFVGKLLERSFEIRSLDSATYGAIVASCGVAVIVVSSLTYRFVEHPGIDAELRFRGATGRTRSPRPHLPIPFAPRRDASSSVRSERKREDR